MSESVIWRDVVGYEGIYEVSNTGLVRTHKNKVTYSTRHGKRKWKQRILKQKVSSKDNNHRVSLYKDKSEKTWLVHRLVAIAFIPLVEGKDYINHIDGDRNNNSVSNLEWCNHKENNNHAFDNGLISTGQKVEVINKKNGEVNRFRSLSMASFSVGKAHSYISHLFKKGKSEDENYIFKKV